MFDTTAVLDALLASSSEAIISKTLDGVVTSWNPGAERIFGYASDEMVGCSTSRIVPPELLGQEEEILTRLRDGESIENFETVRIAKDGHRVDVVLTIAPLRDHTGRVAGMSQVARDISERKDAELAQRRLIDKLDHRIKNTLATVQAIARQSLVYARNPNDFVDAFTLRIQALAKAHSLLTESKMLGASLSDIVQEQSLIGGFNDRVITYAGPRVQLDPQQTLNIALILHELASNARKYGALCTAGGVVAVTWQTVTVPDRALILNWDECGGPAVQPPKEGGFGIKLIHQTARSHGGRARIEFRPQGVHCRIELPLRGSELTASDVSKRPIADFSLIPSAPHDKSNILKGTRILVVEDEPLIAMDIRTCLTEAGCEVIGPTGTVPEAKVLVETEEFHAALLDLNLEGTSSEELAQALSRKNIPFAFATGYRRSALPPEFRECIVLAKPFEREQLVAIAEALVYSRRVVHQRRHDMGASAA